MPNLPVFKRWPSDLVVKTTPELIRMYEHGFQGAFKDPAEEERVFDSLTYKTFGDVAHENDMAGDGEGKLSVGFDLVQRLNPHEYPGPAQRTGCCVSRGTVNAFSSSYAYEVWNGIPDNLRASVIEAVKGGDGAALDTIFSGGDIAERWPTTPNPDQQTFDHVTIYGERGHRGQGANCSTLAAAARDLTGLVPRGIHEIPDYGTYDCTLYDDRAAARSGPRHKDSFRKYANKQHVRDVTQCTDIDEARDAIANHYGINVCSGFACRSTRPSVKDSKGNVCAAPNTWRGHWGHAMAWLGCDDRPWAHKAYGGPLFLICNSWGRWNGGPRRVYDTDLEIPEGCMWITWRDAKSMLRGGGAYIISNVKGFPRRPLTVSWW